VEGWLMTARLWRVRAAVLLALSASGFLNGLVFRARGPGADLGIIAGALAAVALRAASRNKGA
jgi:hypothetical protein